MAPSTRIIKYSPGLHLTHGRAQPTFFYRATEQIRRCDRVLVRFGTPSMACPLWELCPVDNVRILHILFYSTSMSSTIQANLRPLHRTTRTFPDWEWMFGWS